MNELRNKMIQCPYCWEMIEIVIDCSVESQSYIEDCQVCCRPITISVSMEEGNNPQVNVFGETTNWLTPCLTYTSRVETKRRVGANRPANSTLRYFGRLHRPYGLLE